MCLRNRAITPIIVTDTDFPNEFRLILLHFVADDAAAQCADDYRSRLAAAAADQAPKAAAYERPRHRAGAADVFLAIDLPDRFDRADARDGLVVHLVRRLLCAAHNGDCRHDQQREMADMFYELHGVTPERGTCATHSGIAFSRYMAASKPEGRPSLPSHWANMPSMSPDT